MRAGRNPRPPDGSRQYQRPQISINEVCQVLNIPKPDMSPEELSKKMIADAEYTNTIPLTDNEAITAACTEIATRWEEEIIPLME